MIIIIIIITIIIIIIIAVPKYNYLLLTKNLHFKVSVCKASWLMGQLLQIFLIMKKVILVSRTMSTNFKANLSVT